MDHAGAHCLRRSRTAVQVNVEAVRRDAECLHLGAELPKYGGGHAVSGAVGAVKHDLEAVEHHALGEALLGGFDITAGRVVKAVRAPEVGWRRERVIAAILHARLDLHLGGVQKLVAIGTK